MSHKSRKCLKMQSKDVLDSLKCFGRSKYQDKLQAAAEYDRLRPEGMSKQEYINSALRPHIYSYKTYGNYVKHINYFLAWCEERYGCKTLKQCREHVDEWLQERISSELSAYTLKLEAAALGKLYQEPSKNFTPTPSRERGSITRSRGYALRDAGFSLEKNREIIDFCRATGLRRAELESLTGSQLIEKPEGYFIAVKGKGGRYRESPVIGPHAEEVAKRMRSAGSGKIWEKVPSHMDVHSYRSEYATAIYSAYVRDPIPEKDRYYCRGDRKGTVMDKVAMLKASEALGHSRIDVVAGHYIR